MGLDEFVSEGSSGLRDGRSTTQKTQQSSQEEKEPFKVVQGDKGREKVFPTEEDWDGAVEVLEEELGYTKEEVLNKPSDERYQILHQAILRCNGLSEQSFHPQKECIVCGEKFTFPSNWNFTRFKGEAVCNDHSIEETMKRINTINEIES